MGIFGYGHVAFGILALAVGLVIFRLPKGTRLHRVLGYLYVAALLGLNATALMIYRLFGTFGPFHVLVLVSLATLIVGFLPAYFKRPPGKWLRRHYMGICLSYVGLVAATAAEIAVRLPFIQPKGLAFWSATFMASFLVAFGGAFLVYRYREQVLAGLQPPRPGSNQSLQPTGAVPSAFGEPKVPEGGPSG